MKGLNGIKRKAAAVILSLAMAVAALPPGTADAMMAPVDAPATDVQADRARDLQTVRQTLESRIIRQRLNDMGLSRTEVERRLSRLSDEQVHQVALSIERQNPAGDTGGILLVAAAVVLFVVLIAKLLKGDDDDDDDDNEDDNVTNVNTPAPAATPPATAPSPTSPETIIVK